eukprot:131784-Amphidinium_carterae.1
MSKVSGRNQCHTLVKRRHVEQSRKWLAQGAAICGILASLHRCDGLRDSESRMAASQAVRFIRKRSAHMARMD